ncbi:protein DEK [Mangifera indica]|uniref:protein DEK n=1 Tax=Mangifera indica TaxID=29780 RepID=UPI001CFA645C|nr:protein DEK [Mangifera indica]XP_044498600.1 protein DEK [Mangifera indica]
MGEEETKSEVPEVAANGTTNPVEKPVEFVGEKKEIKEDRGVKQVEKDTKDDGVKEMEEDAEGDGVKELEEDKKMDGVNDTEENKKADAGKEMEEDKKDAAKTDEKVETEKMEEDPEVKEEAEQKLDKGSEEPKTEAIKEENEENDEKNGEQEEVNEKAVEAKEKDHKKEESKMLKESTKLGKEKSESKVKGKKSKLVDVKEPEQRTPVTDRPVRERKSVERLVASIEKDVVKEFQIAKGRGTPLKDIPNVAFKLSRRKTDDTFRLLHTILFGRRGKAFQVKSNISRFSGFVWHENEEKQKIKVKEKFDKCNKEKLLELCDVLDIPISKNTRRKEDIVTSLIDFLLAPHATTTELLAEKESRASKKRKRAGKQNSTSGSTPLKRSAKSRRKTEDASKKKGTDSEESDEEEEEEKEEESEEEEKEEENGVPEPSDDEMPEPSESEDKSESEEESEEDVRKRKRSSKTTTKKKQSAGKASTKKIAVTGKSSPPLKRTPKNAPSKRSKADEDSDISPKVFSRKRKNEKVTTEKASTPTKSTPKEKPGRKASKGKEKAKEEELRPSDEDLRDAICEILKEVDFNTATFTDILKQLAQRFDMDLTPRKSSIKLMIQEELTKLADEAGDEDGEGDTEKGETQSTGQEVEA